MRLNRFEIGTPVIVTATIDSVRQDHKKQLLRVALAKPRHGWIVGAARRYEGTVMPGGHDEQAHLKASKILYVWLVRFGLANREEAAFDADVTPLPEGHVCGFDQAIKCGNGIHANPDPWPDIERNYWSECSQDQPRGSDGRWVSSNKNAAE